MLVNTKEVIKYGKKTYIVFIDPNTDMEEFIETQDADSEFDSY